MIRKFISYIKDKMSNQPCIYKIHEINEEYVHSMYVDIDNDTDLGRVTLWDDNSCVMEIINIETENDLLCERYEFSSINELIEKFDNFYSILSQTGLHGKLKQG